MKTHNLEILSHYADAVLDGSKMFEIRRNNRAYQKGDFIKFEVVKWDGMCPPRDVDHGLWDKVYEITYVLPYIGLKDDFVALGIKPKLNE